MKQIDLRQGNPIDLLPQNVLSELKKQIDFPTNHRYPINESEGYQGLREQISKWYYRRYNVSLNPISDIGILLGAKEGILYFLLSNVSRNDYVIITNPCYQTYKFLISYVGAIPYEINIGKENNYMPDFEMIPKSIIKKTKAIIVNYPNNPTCALANQEFFDYLISFAIKNNIKVVNDNPYLEYIPCSENKLSILNSKNANSVCVEFNSFSKTFNMAGWRLGMIMGNENIISKMVQLKKMVDAGPFLALQKAAIKALDEKNDIYIQDITNRFAIRKEKAINTFKELGWTEEFQKGTYYIWLPCRNTKNSQDYCKMLEQKAGLLVTPGTKYGSNGEGYVRLSLALTENDFQEVLHRIKKIYK